MANTHTIKIITGGYAMISSTAYPGGYVTPEGGVGLQELGSTLLRISYRVDGRYRAVDIDLTPVTGDTVIMKDASDATTATYGVGAVAKTSAELNAILNPLFINAARTALTLARNSFYGVINPIIGGVVDYTKQRFLRNDGTYIDWNFNEMGSFANLVVSVTVATYAEMLTHYANMITNVSPDALAMVTYHTEDERRVFQWWPNGNRQEIINSDDN